MDSFFDRFIFIVSTNCLSTHEIDKTHPPPPKSHESCFHGNTSTSHSSMSQGHQQLVNAEKLNGKTGCQNK